MRRTVISLGLAMSATIGIMGIMLGLVVIDRDRARYAAKHERGRRQACETRPAPVDWSAQMRETRQLVSDSVDATVRLFNVMIGDLPWLERRELPQIPVKGWEGLRRDLVPPEEADPPRAHTGKRAWRNGLAAQEVVP